MNQPFKIDLRAVKRVAYTMMAALLVVAGLPFINSPKAHATQLANRSIQMSDSAISGTSITSGVGSGVAVTYRVSFTASNAAGSLVIDFCGDAGVNPDSPIIGDTCTAPPGMTVLTGFSNVTGQVENTNWVSTGSSGGKVKLAHTGGGGSDISSGQQIFDITGITNPTNLGTFYARILTYTNTTFGGGGGYVSPTNVGTYADYGGIALSTTRTITITAKVQEQLTFCVSNSAPSLWVTTNDCSDTAVTAPAVILGHGAPGKETLDASATDVANVYTQLSTNATNGAVVNIRSNNTTCTGPVANSDGGLSADGGVTCAIPPINNGSNAGPTLLDVGQVTGAAAFGLFVSNSQSGPSGVGTLSANSKYHDNAHALADPTDTTPDPDTWYGMDSTSTQAASGGNFRSYNDQVTGLFGSTIASTTTPVYRANTLHQFAATASLTTPAGIYTANMSMIATGTF